MKRTGLISSEGLKPETGSNRDAGGGKPRLAQQIAFRIEERIMSEHWSVGHPIGREADLAAAAGVSRWTFREAVALLEQHGLVTSRRGGHGGLFVSGRMIDMLGNRLATYLDFVRVSPDELTIALRAADEIMISAVSSRREAVFGKELDDLLASAEDLRRDEALLSIGALRERLMEASGNTGLALMSATLSAMVMQCAWYSTLDDAEFRAVVSLISAEIRDTAMALREDDPEAARAASARYVTAAHQLFAASASFGNVPRRSGSTDRAYRIFPPGRPQKKAERVARELKAIIVESGWQVGMHIGTEDDMMARFGVGRPVLREALRSLERMGVIAIRRGAASGVKVISPDPSEVVQACRRFLAQQGFSAAQAERMRAALRQNTPTPHAVSGHKLELFPIFDAIFAPASEPTSPPGD